METSTLLFCQTHHYSSASSPPPTVYLRLFHHHHHQNVRLRPNFTMPLRDLTLRRLTTNQNHFRFNQATQSVSIAKQRASVKHREMAEERTNKDVLQGKLDGKTLSVSKSAEAQDKSMPAAPLPPPPPPEKPLPGDCCGSGCVRCVWDVYYEELEEYNRLCKADQKTS